MLRLMNPRDLFAFFATLSMCGVKHKSLEISIPTYVAVLTVVELYHEVGTYSTLDGVYVLC